MRSVTQLKSLGDIRTTISTHTRSTPRLKGSTYLEVYLLNKEKQRLETEMAMLIKRQTRVQARLGEIREAVENLLSKARQEEPPGSGPGRAAPGASGPDSGPWKRMTVGY